MNTSFKRRINGNCTGVHFYSCKSACRYSRLGSHIVGKCQRIRDNYSITIPACIVSIGVSPLGTGRERCRSGRHRTAFYDFGRKIRMQSECGKPNLPRKQNIKKEQIIGFLQETSVTCLSCQNPKSAQTDLEIGNTRVSL